MLIARPHDALVAGGGPAGAMLALQLARAGCDVLLMERSREAHHKVCGEFLSPECLPLLRSAGVDPFALGAQTISRLRILGRNVIAETELPEGGFALTRRTLDEALLRQASRSGVKVLRGCAVERLERAGELWKAQAAMDGGSLQIHARDAFIATGKHDLRSWKRDVQDAQHDMIALKMYFTLDSASAEKLAGGVELVFFPGGYAGLLPVEDGKANLSVVVQRDRYRALGANWDALVRFIAGHAPALAARLRGARACLERPLAAYGMPYGYSAAAAQSSSAPWRLGDQAAVIPSFTGDGVAIALHTAQRAADCYLRGDRPDAMHAEVKQRLGRRLAVATWLSRVLVAAPALAQGARLYPGILRALYSATRVPVGLQSQLGPAPGSHRDLAARALLFLCVLLGSVSLSAAAQPTPMLGDWQEPTGSVIRIAPCAGLFCMQLVHLAPAAPSTDLRNPDRSKRARPLCGLVIGSGFHMENNGHATGGTLYDPKSGNTYRGTLWIEDGALHLRGYIGIALFGRTEVWKRAATVIEPCPTSR